MTDTSAPATPAQLADRAAEAIRALNHATLNGGLVYPGDAYDAGPARLAGLTIPRAALDRLHCPGSSSTFAAASTNRSSAATILPTQAVHSSPTAGVQADLGRNTYPRASCTAFVTSLA